MNQHYADWATPNRRMDWEYTETQWAQDVLKAVNDGKPMNARLVAEARRIVGECGSIDGLKELLRALNNVAYSQMVAEDKVVMKYTMRYTVIDFRLRGWYETQRVREAHLQHWQDVELSKLELERGA